MAKRKRPILKSMVFPSMKRVLLSYDENAIQFFDPDHSQGEDRFILLGISFKLRVLVVCHCFRKEETVVRIISARKADRGEEKEYWRLKK